VVQGYVFLHAHLNNSKLVKQLIATLQLPEIQPKGHFTGLHDNNCEIYIFSSDPTIVYVLCQYNIPDDRAYIWTSTLFNNILSQEVIVLDALPESLYKSSSISALPLLKKLETDANKEKSGMYSNIEYLEAPNIVDKTPAAILTYCQLRYKKACLVLSLQVNQRVELEAVFVFEQLLSLIIPTLNNTKIPQNFYQKTLNMYNTTSGNPLFL